MIWNTIWMAFLGAFVNVLASTLVAYSVSKFKYPGRNFVYALAIFVQVVPILGAGSAGYKLHVTLGMINNPSLIWIGWLSGFDFAFLVLYGYFMSISETYSEAAEIEGAGYYSIMFRIVLPLVKTVIMTIFLMQFITCWNNYTSPLVYLKSHPTLAYGVFYLVFINGENIISNEPMRMAGSFILFTPILVLFLVFKDVLMQNLSMGGLKE